MNAFTQKPDMSRFRMQLMQAHQASKAGRRAAERHNFTQSDRLSPFTAKQRAGTDNSIDKGAM